MKKFLLVLMCLGFGFGTSLHAQGTPLPTTADSTVAEGMGGALNKRDQPSMLELGITAYPYAFLSGDVTSKYGYGAGIHVRKSIDHLFSVRGDLNYVRTTGDNESDSESNRSHETNWVSGTGYAVMTLNNFKFKGDIRNWNLNLMAGAGVHSYRTEFQCTTDIGSRFGCDGTNRPDRDRPGVIERDWRTHAAAGFSVYRRLSERINLGVDFQAFIPFGNRADLMDGYQPQRNNLFRDVQNAVGVTLNFNLGSTQDNTEPRYWSNAFTPLKEDIAALNTRVDEATMDTDGDGIVNSVDQEPDTPTGVPVDSRGRTLDSDKDGVPDYRDLEPFFPPREGEEVDADGVVMVRNDAPLTQPEIQALIDTSINRALAAGDRSSSTRINTAGGAIYLPMIYFPLNSSEIKYEDYGQLASIARVMQANPGMRLVVRGYTDRTGNVDINTRLSYQRARSVIEHLVENGGIDRHRLILQYRGEEEAIVPLDRSRVNRRVEFLTGMGEDATEDAAPEGVTPEEGRE